ncbi:MAG TPA: ATP-dependent DNA helicase [Pyrinomonadaceae bacterium]
MVRPHPLQSDPNAAQSEAIRATAGPVQIIAGPGSGKTFTLVERIAELITGEGATPENLLVVTFTDKAAQELITRVSNKLDQLGFRFNLNEIYLGTFHSICLRLLQEKREYTRLRRNFTMLDEFDQQYFLYQHLDFYKELPGHEHILGTSEKTSSWQKSENLLKWVNKVSEEALDPERLTASDDEGVVALGLCYQLYHRQLDEANALDFSTIQVEALRLIQNHPPVLAGLREKIKYLMVDEYQDTNTIQEQILFALAGEQSNICVVGDDDQGLYRFRGATIRNILEFADKFPKGQCKQIPLTVNYRSHPGIINFFNEWMDSKDWRWDDRTFRLEKEIVPRPGAFPQVPAVLKVSVKGTPEEWHEEVLAFLRALRDCGTLKDWNQVAFLFRSVKNPKVVALARYLESQGVPVYSPRSNLFFEREEVRLMIGALIFLFPQFLQARAWKPDAHLHIWDYYDRCFEAFAKELRKAENAGLLEWARRRARTHLTLAENADYAFSGLFYQLLHFPLFSWYLGDSSLGNVMESRPARNLSLFSRLLNKFEYLHRVTVLNPKYLDKNIRNLFNQFLRFLKDGGIFEYETTEEYAPPGCVSFLTVHQAKGLEFPVVIVGSLDSVPRRAHTELDEVLEENYLEKPPFEPLDRIKFYDFWRLYYTAFSRAQNLLVLSCREKDGKGQTPSKYFADCYKSLPSWRSPTLDLKKIRLDDIKQSDLKKQYSFTSHITLFENCSEQYRFFKELEFSPVRANPIVFGLLIHQTIEDIHKAALRGEEHKITPEQIDSWFNVNYANISKSQRVYLAPPVLEAARRQIALYVEREGKDWSRLREAEVDVSLVKDTYILKGTIDLISGEGETVEIIDFKSEKKPDLFSLDGKAKIDRYRRQLEVYAHIVEEQTGHKVSRTHLYYTGEESGNPYVTFQKNRQSISATIRAFDAVVARIEGKDFSLAQRPIKLCEACDMRHYCDSK